VIHAKTKMPIVNRKLFFFFINTYKLNYLYYKIESQFWTRKHPFLSNVNVCIVLSVGLTRRYVVLNSWLWLPHATLITDEVRMYTLHYFKKTASQNNGELNKICILDVPMLGKWPNNLYIVWILTKTFNKSKVIICTDQFQLKVGNHLN